MRDLDIHHVIMNNVIITMYNKYLAHTSQELKNIDTEHADYDNDTYRYTHTIGAEEQKLDIISIHVQCSTQRE